MVFLPCRRQTHFLAASACKENQEIGQGIGNARRGNMGQGQRFPGREGDFDLFKKWP
jgi:hypothetical protein